ncbi:ABC-three component system middle component 5 [Ruegeria arenilitoris]|uniref:ABC-three component system middle component 5 n=1 Tax=Ruegeria arenilitoris TaxID=1173585 RepID=UPI00147DB4D1|nr:ABC-three component system middle component 5 [Ruegeria arenilitoris]
MTQLSYQPAFDPYNAMFRLLQLRERSWLTQAVPYDALRIADFFLLFPFFLQDKDIRYKPEHRSIRSVGKKYKAEKPYSRLPDKRTLFRRVEPFQVAAIGSLVNGGFVEADSWEQRIVEATPKEIPNTLLTQLHAENSANSELIDAILKLLMDYPLTGKDGLKDRTGLLEYRYDVV